MIFGPARDVSKLEMRAARADDAEAIWRLVLMHFPDAESMTGTEIPVLALQLQKQAARGWVIPDGRHLAAAGVIRPEECYIWMLYVHARRQGAGLGARMLNHMLKRLRQAGCARATLRTPVGSAAEGFYTHLSWRRLHTTPSGTHVVYVRDVPAAAAPRPGTTANEV